MIIKTSRGCQCAD